MSTTDLLAVVMRYVHLVSTICIIGGMAFISFCLRPSLRLVDDNFRDALLRMAQGTFQRVVLAGIAGLLISGTYNWVRLNDTYLAMRDTVGHGVPIGHILIGSKTLLALLMFAVVFLRLAGVLKNARFWHTFNLHLGAVVILLAVILHQLRLEHLRLLASVGP